MTAPGAVGRSIRRRMAGARSHVELMRFWARVEGCVQGEKIQE